MQAMELNKIVMKVSAALAESAQITCDLLQRQQVEEKSKKRPKVVVYEYVGGGEPHLKKRKAESDWASSDPDIPWHATFCNANVDPEEDNSSLSRPLHASDFKRVQEEMIGEMNCTACRRKKAEMTLDCLRKGNIALAPLQSCWQFDD